MNSEKEKSSHVLSFAVDNEMHEVIRRLRDVHHLNVSSLVRELLVKEFNRRLVSEAQAESEASKTLDIASPEKT